MSYERCFERMQALAREYSDVQSESWNESDTRLRVINVLLNECLAWPRAHTRTEKRLEQRYSDYELGSDSARVVVEAKRAGTWFRLPAGQSKRVRSLKSLAQSSTELKDALRQVTEYCTSRGIPIAVLCNGDQIVAFLGSRTDGIPPIEGDALTYASLSEMAEDFQPIWDALSPPGVAANNLGRALVAEAPSMAPDKPSTWMADYPGIRRRNDLQANLQLLGQVFFEDLDKVPELATEALAECYCWNGALSQYSFLSRSILASRYSGYFEEGIGVPAASATVGDGLSDEFSGDFFSTALMSRPVCLVGDVGVGKTTFIKHLIEVGAAEELKDALVMYVDLGVSPTLMGNLEAAIQDQIETQLRNKYDLDIFRDEIVRGVHNLEIERFRSGIYGRLRETNPDEYLRKEIEFLASLVADRTSHIEACLRHFVRGQGKQVVVFLDNIDQREISFQERVFLIAQSMAETWPVTVFVSIRPDTLIESRQRGSLDAYQLRVFTISPPRIDEVIDRRIKYAHKKLVETGSLPLASGAITVTSDNLVKMLDIVDMSLKRNDDLRRMIDSLCLGNVRDALELLVTFMGSGNVNTEKIISIFNDQGRYYIPVHEFLRAIMLKDYRHYYPPESYVANVLDISSSDGREHFLIPSLLAFVERTGRESGRDGYVDISSAYQHLQSAGFSPSRTDWATERALKFDLLESDTPSADMSGSRALRVTSAGAYTLRELLGTFAYLDGLFVDLPITDAATRERVTLDDGILQRLERAEQLLSYLDVCWQPLDNADLVFDWGPLASRLRGEIQKAHRGALRRRRA